MLHHIYKQQFEGTLDPIEACENISSRRQNSQGLENFHWGKKALKSLFKCKTYMNYSSRQRVLPKGCHGTLALQENDEYENFHAPAVSL